MDNAPPAWRWQTHAEAGSTQDLAIAAAQAGDPGRLAILADRQTGGRGSRGRVWLSPEGNLNLSLLLCPGAVALDAGRWALLAGVALHDALAPYATGLMLKWPNDLLLNGNKLGGILIDSHPGDDTAAWVVIGFGANLATQPALQGRAAACLPPPAPSAAAVGQAVLEHWDAHGGQTTQAICTAWLARAHKLGTLLDVQTPLCRLSGTFAGLTPRGELRLQNHIQPISSAEVFLQTVKTGGLEKAARLTQPCPPCS